MQAEPEAVDNTSWTGDETTAVSNQQSMLAVWDMAAWSRTIIGVIAPIAGTHTAQFFFPCCVNPNVCLNRRTSHPIQVTALPGMRQGGLGARDECMQPKLCAPTPSTPGQPCQLPSGAAPSSTQRTPSAPPSLASSPPPAMCMQRCVNPHSSNCDIFRGVQKWRHFSEMS